MAEPVELIVAAVNRLWNTTFDHIPDWEKKIAQFFDEPRNFTIAIFSSAFEAKRMLIDGKVLLPEHEQYANLCRAIWTEMRDELPVDFDAIRVQIDFLLQIITHPTYNFTPMQLIKLRRSTPCDEQALPTDIRWTTLSNSNSSL